MPKVVVALLNAEQEFQQLQAKDARETAARLKLDVEVAFAEGHAVVQIQQLFKHIHAPEARAAGGDRGGGGDRRGARARGAQRREGGDRLDPGERAGGLRRRAAAGAPGPADRDARHRPERGRAHPGPAVPGARPRRAATCCACRARRTRRSTVGRFEGLKEALGAGFEVRGLNGDWTEASGEKAVVVLAAPQDGRGVPARRRGLPERLDGRRARGRPCASTAGSGRACPSWAATGCPRAARGWCAEGVLAATVVTPSNTGPALEIVARWLQTKQVPPREVLLAAAVAPAGGPHPAAGGGR